MNMDKLSGLFCFNQMRLDETPFKLKFIFKLYLEVNLDKFKTELPFKLRTITRVSRLKLIGGYSRLMISLWIQ